ncbi:hypothetical protein ACH4A8_08405 [Streptomyces vietnamensis]|uniref:hypothetical protein n=1 Tax=Streptomyces vietnamensis TaxID=362257 RepID=UPI003795B24D
MPQRTLRLPEGVNDIERYADHVESAITDLDDLVLVGASFGANIALATRRRRACARWWCPAGSLPTRST